MEKVLKLNEPLLSTYPEYGHLFSIIDMTAKSMDWIYSSFIQIYSRMDPSNGYEFTAYKEHMELEVKVPTVQYFKLPEDFIKEYYGNNVVEAMIDYIDKGYYITTIIDRYYIKACKEYHKYNFPHLSLFYGYDTDKEVFYVKDNFENGVYSSAEFKFNEVSKSFFSFVDKYKTASREEGVLTIIKNIDFAPYVLSKKYLINELKFYLNSYAMSKEGLLHFNILNCYEHHGDEIKYFNLGIYDYLKNKIDKFDADENHIDIRAFCILCEHKGFMIERVKYLTKRGFITNSEEVLKLFEQSFFLAQLIVNMTMKLCVLSILKRKNYKRKVLEKLNKLEYTEIEGVTKLIKKLEA